MAAKMLVAQFAHAGGSLELAERPLPEPGPGQVRLKVAACGICHGDVVAKLGQWPGLTYPRVPGHEVAGRIDALGAGVTAWKEGQRAGLGWHGGQCFTCTSCRAGDFAMCRERQTVGLTFDGGYAEYCVAPASALVAIPEPLTAVEAAPILCAGLTTYNALRHSVAQPGDLVAIQGIGGLGHLGIAYAAKMGFRTVAIGRRPEKAALAQKLGAEIYIDGAAVDPAKALQELGGARVILATSFDGKAIPALVGGLAPRGHLIIAGAPHEPLVFPGMAFIAGAITVSGWNAGVARDAEDTLRFSVQTGVRPMVETYPLTKAAEAFAHAMQSKARFRVVLTMPQ